MTVQFSLSFSPERNTRIGIFPSERHIGEATQNSGQYLDSQNLNGRSSGEVILKTPQDPGFYELRIFSSKNERGLEWISFQVEEENSAVVFNEASFEIPAEAQLDDLLQMEHTQLRNPSGGLLSGSFTRKTAELRALIAMRYLEQENLETAYDYLFASLELDPSHGDRWEYLGDMAQILDTPNSKASALLAYQHAVILEPFRHTARLKLINAFVMHQDYEKAIENLEIFFSESTDLARWSHISRLTTLYPLANQTRQGIDYFQKIFLQEGDNRFALAWAILSNLSGKSQEALQILDMIIESEANNSSLRFHALQLKNQYKTERP
ncbi:MAG: hypothetical protein HQM13_23180 [SAR324 cluster bacterium]|nr:hypothetical protein [SAR324 cluster bacterium]